LRQHHLLISLGRSVIFLGHGAQERVENAELHQTRRRRLARIRKSHHHIPVLQERSRRQHLLAVVKDGSTHPDAQKLVVGVPGHLARGPQRLAAICLLSLAQFVAIPGHAADNDGPVVGSQCRRLWRERLAQCDNQPRSRHRSPARCVEQGLC
jgi:hypothetical protein